MSSVDNKLGLANLGLVDVEIQTEEVSPCYYQLTVTVPFDLIASDYERAVNRLGLDKKAVARTIKKKAAQDRLEREFLPELLNRFSYEAVVRAQIEPIAAGRCQVVAFKENEPFVFELIVPTEPKVQLGDYKTIEVWEPLTTVTDSEVEERLLKLKKQAAKLEDKQAPAEPGDVAVVNVEAKQKRNRLVDRCRQNYPLELTTPSPDEHLVGRLLGVKAGQTKIFALEDEIEGQTQLVNYVVTVKKVKKVNLPTDEELAAREGCKDEQEVKEKLRKELLEEKEKAKEEYVKEAVLEKLRQNCEFHIPAEFVEIEAGKRYQQVKEEAARRSNKFFEQHLKSLGLTEEKFFAELKEHVVDGLRDDLMLVEVAREEGLEPTEGEVCALAADLGHLKEIIYDPEAVCLRLKQLGLYDGVVSVWQKKKAYDALQKRVSRMKPAVKKWSKTKCKQKTN